MKKLVIIILLVVCSISEDINSNVHTPHIKLAKEGSEKREYMIPCFDNFLSGECDDLDPPATGCLWAPGEDKGFCIHSSNGELSKVFRTNRSKDL
jgi:hypothetical protein